MKVKKAPQIDDRLENIDTAFNSIAKVDTKGMSQNFSSFLKFGSAALPDGILGIHEVLST